MLNIRCALFVIFTLLSSIAFAQSNACPQGDWDMGPQAAVLRFECDTPTQGILRLCPRKMIYETGDCPSLDSIECSSQNTGFVCIEENPWNFRAEIQTPSESELVYKFSSSFNSGELQGKRIEPILLF